MELIYYVLAELKAEGNKIVTVNMLIYHIEQALIKKQADDEAKKINGL